MSPLGRRWDHVRSVAQLASAIEPAFPAVSPGELVCAALLHDIGYSDQLAETGFHPLDGGRWVRAQGHERIACAVAHHSGARVEARLRQISDFEDEFPFADDWLDRALTYCDMTTSPEGSRVRLSDRVAEINARYGGQHTVTRAINASVPEFEEWIAEVEQVVEAAGIQLNESLAYRR
jgi:hypothetical protein